MELHLPIGEQYERWRGDGCLRQIKNFDPLAHRDRGAVEVHVLEETVHLPGGDALPAFGGNLLEDREDFVGSLPLGG